MIDCLVTTAGGIEEDFVKCLGGTYIGEGGFEEDGAGLRKRGCVHSHCWIQCFQDR